MSLSLLVHTFDAYRHLWPGCIKSLQENWGISDPKIYWGTDIQSPDSDRVPFKVLYSGSAEWSDRLRSLLKQIPADYVMYMQEDHYLFKSPPNIEFIAGEMVKNGLLRLQIAPINHFYTLFSEENTIYFDVKSKYLVSHQPSIWNKKFLLSCLEPGETPWVNEYKGTLRLQKDSATRDYIHKKIAIYPYDWFTHHCIKGRVVGMQ